MKELSVEQKAKAYDEAIEKAESLYKVSEPMSGCNVIIETLFPELKKSGNEDERIMKALINGFNKLDKSAVWYNGITNAQILDWLEKQGEHANFRNKIQIGDKVTRNSDGVLVNLSQLNRVAKVDEKQGEQKPTDEEMKELLRTEYEKGRADAIAEMQKSWSEEDEKFFKTALWHISYSISNGKSTDFHCDTTDWLESLKYRVQPKQEWSEEDIDNIKNIIILCTHSIEGIEYVWIPSQAAKIKELMESILYSSKPQPQWKPSKEQMKLLREVQQALLGKDCHNRFVNFMYELKRLREE